MKIGSMHRHTAGQLWPAFLSAFLLFLPITLVSGSPLGPDIENKTALASINIVDNYTFTEGHQPPKSNGINLNITGINVTGINVTNTTTPTPVLKAALEEELDRRANGDDEDEDGEYELEDDEDPHDSADMHDPVTLWDFFTSDGFRVECLSARFVLGIVPHNNNPNLPISQWPPWSRIRGSWRARTHSVLSYQERCRNCRCTHQGVMIMNPIMGVRGINGGPRQCWNQLVVDTCVTAAGCFCTATLTQPSDIPVTASAKEIQDALDEIPLGIKLRHSNYKYLHHDGTEFGFTPFQPDPNYIIDRRPGEEFSPAPPTKLSASGKIQYLVPGTKEPYYLEGPDPPDTGRQTFGNSPLSLLFPNQAPGSGKSFKRDVSSEAPGPGTSSWDKDQTLKDALKGEASSPASKDDSALGSDATKPTKTVGLP
ncbi:hypothetical protein TWF481_001149 [Arthrobotrys musiformis]|uniref:Uncharacterized protein n=1 Tax=Arthrobotrys musiformis TaxID=47236 RepID=A0AAV9WQQ9_9PEZI